MGGAGSTRRVTVEGTDGPGVVKISENVVQRLKGKPDTVSKDDGADSRFREHDIQERRPPIGIRSQSLTDLEAYYQAKLKQLEDRNDQLYKTTNEQFARAVQEVERKFLKHTGSPVCQDLQQEVYNCYQTNQNRTLNCSSHVKAFTSCVENARQNALVQKG